jgi:hypothetical protein
VATDTSVNQNVQGLLANASQYGKDVISAIYQYVDNMRPGVPLTPQEGARNQVALYRALSMMFNRLENDFEDVFRAALMLVDAHADGAFAATHRFRFMDHATVLEEADKAAFTRWIHLMTSTASVQGREQALKQVDVEGSLAAGTSERAKQKVMGFFGL